MNKKKYFCDKCQYETLSRKYIRSHVMEVHDVSGSHDTVTAPKEQLETSPVTESYSSKVFVW